MRQRRALGPAVAAFLCLGCARGTLDDGGPRSGHPLPPPPLAPAAPPPASVAASSPDPQASAAPAPPSAATYLWLADPAAAVPPAVDALDQRFAPPAGFTRVPLDPASFGAWLRRLPLAPRGTSVVSYRGDLVLPRGHDNLAAVVAIDVGRADLQQCADSVIRLHAEWLYAQGRRDMSYRAASGGAMPFARWARGERMTPQGISFAWSTSGRADTGHASFRRWLDAVFTWANTGSLARDTEPVTLEDLRPGDFVVQPGAPGHAVLVLDLARTPDGRRALLLGQGFMPAQSFHVLRPGHDGGRPPIPPGPAGHDGPAGREAGAWFVVEPGAIALDTPFWAPFPWKTLRRFPGA